MRVAVACLLAVVLLSVDAPRANAQQCAPTAVIAVDMAGAYVSVADRMRLDVAPCGGVLVTWDNPFGRHQAVYGVTQRMAGGGLIASGIMNDGFYLDGQTAVGVKPAEPGWVQVLTISPYGDEFKVYRLAKVN